jgi:subtilisin family serine protease
MKETMHRTSSIQPLGLSLLAGWLACLGGLPAVSSAQEEKVRANANAFRSTKELLIHYKPGESDAAKEQAEDWGCEVLEDYKPGKFLRCVPGPGVADVSEIVRDVAASAAVKLVEPNYIVSIPSPPGEVNRLQVATARAAAPVIPDDPDLSKLWGMVNIHAPEAWGRNHDSPVIVGIIDTGVDYDHTDLHANMWRNPDEIPGNNKDDDFNGIVDDVYGVKYENGVGSGDPRDDNRHGTHCAGTIGAFGNNGMGVVGVNWRVKIMALKFLRANGSGAVNDAVKCIDYAIDKKARILNNSWGGGGFSQALQDAISRAEAAGIIFVVAAGNNGALDNDADPNFPSNYPNENIIAVASINPSDDLSSFSHFGKTTVDLAAPGGTGFPFDDDDIYSTLPGNQYGFLAGTSMATPHVSGAAALLLGHPAHENATAAEVKALLMENVRSLPGLAGKCVTGGTLDIDFLSR